MQRGWEYIEEQNEFIVSLQAKNGDLEKQKNEWTNSKHQMNGTISVLNRDVESGKKLAAKDKELMDLLKRQLADSKKDSNQYSAKDQIRIDDARAENQIRLANEREFAKVDAKEESERRKEVNQHKNYRKSKDNYNNHRGGEWKIGCEKYTQRKRRYSRSRNRGRRSPSGGRERQSSSGSRGRRSLSRSANEGTYFA